MFGKSWKLKQIEASLDQLSESQKRRIAMEEYEVRFHRIWAIAIASILITFILSLTAYEIADRIGPYHGPIVTNTSTTTTTETHKDK
jgi:hypothetical protein